MKSLRSFIWILILLLAAVPCVIRAQPENSTVQDTTNLIEFTLFPRADPFQSDQIFRVMLEFDMKKFIKTKYKGEYQKALLIFQEMDSSLIETEIRIRARGEFRRSHCYFPPIKLNFKETEFNNEYMNDIASLKLVTHCKNSTLYEQYILKEYLVYRIFNMLTDSSFRVKFVQIDYIDSEDKMKPFTKYGFIIESNDHLAKRLNGIRIDREGIPTWNTDLYYSNLMTVFQYMIGNTDWAIPVLHNIRLIKPVEFNSGILAIPYDFDYSGMVHANYAIPDEQLGIETVRERVYRGYCLPSDDHYQPFFKVFLEKKQAIFSLVENFDLLDKRHRTDMLIYLEEFYHIIENPGLARHEIIAGCRELPRK